MTVPPGRFCRPMRELFHTASHVVLWLIGVAALALWACSDESSFYDHLYRHMSIDVATRKVTFEGRLWSPPPTGEFYYAERPDFLGRRSATVYRSGSDQPYFYDWIGCDTAYHLMYREKYQLLSPTGPDSILVHTFYPYDPRYGTMIRVETVEYSGMSLNEPPIESDAPPNGARLVLDHISVSRTVAGPSGHRTIMATYGSDGTLQVLASGVGTRSLWSYADEPATRDSFGLRARFDFGEYAAGTGSPFTDTPVRPIADYVYLHYDRGTLVRRDHVTARGRDTRWLLFATTPSDSLLAPIDATRTHGRAIRPALP
jgi:hypothetical protein